MNNSNIKTINSNQLRELVKQVAIAKSGKLYLLLSSTSNISHIIQDASQNFYPIDSDSRLNLINPSDYDVFYSNEVGAWLQPECMDFAYEVAISKEKPVFIMIEPDRVDQIPDKIIGNCEILSVTFRDTINYALSNFIESSNSELWTKYIEGVWLLISEEWDKISEELGINIETFTTKGMEDCTFNNPRKWHDWYENQIFIPAERKEEFNNPDNLPDLPVKIVPSFPLEEDRISIVKEQLIMAAIDAAQGCRCNPETIKDALFDFYNIHSYTYIERQQN